VTTIGAERPNTEVAVILGVDTHLDFHVAVAVDHLGRRLGESSVPATVKGYESLLNWAEDFGPVRCAGVEGTSSYGAGLARHLRARGIEVLEVERPERRRRSSRRNVEKTDPSDAERAARAVLAGETSGVPKSGDGCVEMIRALRAARRSAMKARTQAANQLQGLRVTAPEELRHRLRGLFRRRSSSRWPHTSASETTPVTCLRGHQVVGAPFGGPPLRGPLSRARRARRAPRSAGGASRPRVGLSAGHRYRRRRDALDRGRRQTPEVEERSLLLRQSVRGRSHRSLLWQGRTASSQPHVGNREANRALYMICLARMRRDRRTQKYVALGAPRRGRASERSYAASSATSPGRPTAC
jgi:transposase